MFTKSRLILFTLLLITVITSTLVQAQDFETTLTTVADRISVGEGAKYELKVTSKLDYKTFSLGIDNKDWKASFSENNFKLNNGESKVVEVVLTPMSASYGEHNIALTISADGEVSAQTMSLSYVPSTTGDTDTVTVSPESYIPKEIVPGENFALVLVLKNEKNFPIRDLKLDLTIGDFFSTDRKVDFNEYSINNLEFTLQIPLTVKPQLTNINTKVLDGSTILTEKNFPVEIIKVAPKISAEDSLENKFLKKTTTYKLTNKGNQQIREKFTTPRSFFVRLFSNPSDNGDYNSGEYEWDVTLGPGETKEVSLTTSYRALFVLIIIILVLIGGYQYFKPEIFLSKNFSELSFNKKGTFEAAKVLITLKNKTNTIIKSIQVEELLPQFVGCENRDIQGSIKPVSVDKLDHLTKLTWEFQDMLPGEERIIMYRARARFAVVGELRLPATVVSFRKGGIMKKIYSNNLVARPEFIPMRDDEEDLREDDRNLNLGLQKGDEKGGDDLSDRGKRNAGNNPAAKPKV